MKFIRYVFAIFILHSAFVSATSAQTTEFTYQGSLKNGAATANGNYDFEFALFDTLNGGSQIGSTISRNGVIITDGLFSTSLDFGASFPGANRFLEIHVRQAGAGAFTTLMPRQQISSSPYSVKSLNADSAANATNAQQLGGTSASQYVQTTDPRMTDGRPPLPFSSNYIQNTATTQAGATFIITGSGFANTLGAFQFNLGTSKVLSNNGVSNLFIGVGSASVNTGRFNTFVGNNSGSANTTAEENAFFGSRSGNANLTGGKNAFFGSDSGLNNTSGLQNSFFGGGSGLLSTSGGSNSFFGGSAGATNTTGDHNTAIGFNADVLVANLTNANAIGANAKVGASNALVLGATGTNVGIGANAPATALEVRRDGTPSSDWQTSQLRISGATDPNKQLDLGFDTTTNAGVIQAGQAFTGFKPLYLNPAGGAVIFGGATVIPPSGNMSTSGLTIGTGGLQIINLTGGSGGSPLCAAGSAPFTVGFCSSSYRYKTNLSNYRAGLNVISRLNPIGYDWKLGGSHDIGLGAEDVEKIDKRLVFYNGKGEVEGVRYDRIGVVLINAVKEQQAQIEDQHKKIQNLEEQINLLRALVCKSNKSAKICRR